MDKNILYSYTGSIHICIIQISRSLGVGIDYERGMRADSEKKCQTALKYLTKAQSVYPDSMILNSRIFIDLAKCNKYNEAGNLFNEKLAGQNVDDDLLYKEIDDFQE